MLLRELHRTVCPDVSFRTLKRRLHQFGMRKWKKLKRPALTDVRAAKRLAWAIEHKDWTVDQWKNVIWSDECSVERGSGRRVEYVFRVPEDKWALENVQPTFRSG